MKVIGMIGSLRSDSIHRKIFHHYQELCKDSFELIEGSIRSIPLYTGDEDKNESVEELSKLILESDGVIFFTPEYNYSVPGGLKNAIDWLSRCKPQPFAGKPVSVVGASPGSFGTARMQFHLRQIGIYLDMRFLNKPEVLIGKVFDKVQDGKIQDAMTIDFLQKHSAAFAEFSNS